jgi:hypothetical protein
VLALLVETQRNKQIAHELGISARTVEIHRANLMEKLDCSPYRAADADGGGRPACRAFGVDPLRVDHAGVHRHQQSWHEPHFRFGSPSTSVLEFDCL